MRIAVNAQKLVKDKMEGLGWFAYETLKRMVKSHPEHEFTFIFGKGIERDFIFAENVKAINIGPPYFRPMAWYLKFEYLLPRYINRNNFDLFLSPDGWSSTKIKIKTVSVIHDINFEHYPEFLQKSFCFYYKHFFRKWAHHSMRLATVSEYSKWDIAKTYGISEDKIDVLYNGASNIYSPVEKHIIESTRNKYTEGFPYFVFVGALHPRKNIINLFKAFDKFKLSDNQNIKLVIVGERFYWNKQTEEAFNSLKYQSDIIFTGRLSQEELKQVLGSSLALTYVSLFEGFGIPLVEAMNCEVPIITSNTTSMPEIAGDAAIIVDPTSVDEISKAMSEIATNEKLRSKLIEAGNVRKLDFSWDLSAERFWKTIEKVL
ncbi:MAG: glycosyltransferase family 4 protein [Salinivirgaceae bacterium]|nr:glycosyltransferase family 4 protein [Salinivirgaceae bacterium]